MEDRVGEAELHALERVARAVQKYEDEVGLTAKNKRIKGLERQVSLLRRRLQYIYSVYTRRDYEFEDLDWAIRRNERLLKQLRDKEKQDAQG